MTQSAGPVITAAVTDIMQSPFSRGKASICISRNNPLAHEFLKRQDVNPKLN